MNTAYALYLCKQAFFSLELLIKGIKEVNVFVDQLAVFHLRS